MNAPKLSKLALARLRDIADNDRWFIDDCRDLRALLDAHAALSTKLAAWAREAAHCGSIYSNDAHDVMTELGLWKEHEGEHDYMGGACRVCGKFYSGADFLAAMDAHRAAMTPEEREAEENEFFGPCPHGRDPWTRCDEGCDTIEQAKGLVPPSPTMASLQARIAELEGLLKAKGTAP